MNYEPILEPLRETLEKLQGHTAIRSYARIVGGRLEGHLDMLVPIRQADEVYKALGDFATNTYLDYMGVINAPSMGIQTPTELIRRLKQTNDTVDNFTFVKTFRDRLGVRVHIGEIDAPDIFDWTIARLNGSYQNIPLEEIR